MQECWRIEARQRAVQEVFAAQSVEIQERLAQMTRTQFIYESNALELGGLPLAETEEAIRLAPSALEPLAGYIARAAVTADRHLTEVLGLYRATQFAQQLARDFAKNDIPIREVDVRTLHAATVPMENHAGAYRTIEVGISGSDHVPPSVFEVPRQMSELVTWLNTTAAPPALAAAVVHSWLTIIHPFADGNGRVARLLANVVLLRAGWPALIIRSSDRLQYLDALAASDEGGDLLPLFDLFVKSIKRGLKDLEKPDLAKQLFEADLRRDPNLRYDMWSNTLTAFLNALRESLRRYGFDLDRLRVPATSTFLLLERGDSSGNTWLAKLRHKDGRDFLIWLGYASYQLRDNASFEIPPPGMFISQRDRRPDAVHPYTSPFVDGSPIDIDEFAVVPTVGPAPVFVRFGITVFEWSIERAAEVLADRVGRASA